jgi:hypothetical protein
MRSPFLPSTRVLSPPLENSRRCYYGLPAWACRPGAPLRGPTSALGGFIAPRFSLALVILSHLPQSNRLIRSDPSWSNRHAITASIRLALTQVLQHPLRVTRTSTVATTTCPNCKTNHRPSTALPIYVEPTANGYWVWHPRPSLPDLESALTWLYRYLPTQRRTTTAAAKPFGTEHTSKPPSTTDPSIFTTRCRTTPH